MSDLVVNRWARYGHERPYVQTPEGVRLGYWDCKHGLAVLEPGTDRDAFDAALARHRAGAAPGPPGAGAAGSAPDRGVSAVHTDTSGVEPCWRDLAAARPGAAARDQAVALRRAAPVRTFLARAFGVRNDERAWRVGADGEEAVAARLARLGHRWKVLHAVPVGKEGSDIDHVVIGPGRVFTVNAKHHPDATVWVGGETFMVSGTRVPYVRNSRHEARRAGRLLAAAGAPPATVTGLVAVIGARGGLTVKAQPADGQVVVVARKDLDDWLDARPHVLDDGHVERTYQVARRSSTWVS